MDVLSLVKARLGITIDRRDEYIQAIIDGIKKELADIQGIELDVSNPNHVMFLVDYACYRYENRGEQSGLPRHLQWRLHNLFVGGRKGEI